MESKHETFTFWCAIFGLVIGMLGLLVLFQYQTTIHNAIDEGTLHCTDDVCKVFSMEVMDIWTSSQFTFFIGVIGFMSILGGLLFLPGIRDCKGIDNVALITTAALIAFLMM